MRSVGILVKNYFEAHQNNILLVFSILGLIRNILYLDCYVISLEKQRFNPAKMLWHFNLWTIFGLCFYYLYLKRSKIISVTWKCFYVIAWTKQNQPTSLRQASSVWGLHDYVRISRYCTICVGLTVNQFHKHTCGPGFDR